MNGKPLIPLARRKNRLDNLLTAKRFYRPRWTSPVTRVTAAPAPVIIKQQESTNESVDASPSRASQKPEASHTTNEAPCAELAKRRSSAEVTENSPEPATTMRRKADEALFQLFSSKKVEVKGEQKTAKKKWMTIAAISAGSILLPLVLMIPLFHHGTKSVTKPSVQPLPGASESQPATDAPDPSASKPSAQGKPLPTTGKPTDNG